MLKPSNRKVWVLIILIFLLFNSLMWYSFRAVKRNFSDFHVNYVAGERMLERGNLYDLWKSGLANFKYPPFFAFLMMPLALLNEFWASIVWYVINFFLLVLGFRVIKLISNGGLNYGQGVFFYIATVIINLRFILHNFAEGQVNILMMVSLILSLYFLIKNKDLLAAAFFGFSILIKYMPLILVPYFVFRRKFKFLIFASIFLIAYSLIPALFIGWDYNLSLLKQFVPFVFSCSTDVGSISTNPNQSLLALLMRFLSSEAESNVNFATLDPAIIKAIFLGLFVIFYLLIIVKRRPFTRFREVIDYGLLLTCIALFNPNAWLHAFIFLIFGCGVLIYYLLRINFKDRLIVTAIVWSFILTVFTFEMPFLPKDFFESYSTTTLVGLLIFSGLIKLKFSKISFS